MPPARGASLAPGGRAEGRRGRPGGHESPPSRLHGGLWLLLGGAALCDKAFLGRFHFAVRKPGLSGTSLGPSGTSPAGQGLRRARRTLCQLFPDALDVQRHAVPISGSAEL